MAAEKQKKSFAEIVGISECLLLQDPSNQSSQLSWFFNTKQKTSENPKTVSFRELSLPAKGFKTCSAVNFPKKSRFWRPGSQPKT